MAYYIEVVDPSLTDGKDWIMREEPQGDVIFTVSCDAGRFLMPQCVLDDLLETVYRSFAAADAAGPLAQRILEERPPPEAEAS